MKSINENSIPEEIKYLAELIKNSGYSLYIVGGFVRDLFMGEYGNANADIDICGNCRPDELRSIIENSKEIYLCEANYPLGTLKINIGGISVEYTTFRKESYRGNGYHTPSTVVFTDNIYQDALRRDFTINAIYLDPLSLEIVDPFDGQHDISHKIIKTVRESADVFSEDALRILRMCRFAAKLGFSIDTKTLQGAEQCAGLLKNISRERIGAELDLIISDAEYIQYAVDALFAADISEVICLGVHKETADKLRISPKDRHIRWAVFLSDYSKEKAREYIASLSLGKQFAQETASLISRREICLLEKSEIIIYFAKTGAAFTKKLIDYIAIFNTNDSLYLQAIFCYMNNKKQFISYSMLSITGSDIKSILNADGPAIKHYKDKAYEYAVLNPEKNNYDDLKLFLLSLI
ncbi:MAG: CCA tRNA nucleotidyltransferase [Clostridia bacterium]|nr:CCA tRNA nucleotidyltransferase [Clostridia bacterium]